MGKRRGFRKGSLASKGMKGYMAGRKIAKKGKKAMDTASSIKAKVGAAKGRFSGAVKALKGGRRVRPIRVGRKAMKFTPFSMNKSF